MSFGNARFLLALSACGFTTLGFGAQAPLAAYPERPIRLIVPSPPGGGNDIMARLAAQRLNESWGRSVVVDNRPGAGGAIAFEVAARSEPDGYAHVRSGKLRALAVTGDKRSSKLPEIPTIAEPLCPDSKRARGGAYLRPRARPMRS